MTIEADAEIVEEVIEAIVEDHEMTPDELEAYYLAEDGPVTDVPELDDGPMEDEPIDEGE